MITQYIDIGLLKEKLDKQTKLVFINIVFYNNDVPEVKIKDGRVTGYSNNKVFWSDGLDDKRVLALSSFGQILNNFHTPVVSYFGLFLKEEFSIELVLKSCIDLYNKHIESLNKLNLVIGKFQDEISTRDKLMEKHKNPRYIIAKRRLKFGSDWLNRPYHKAKMGMSLYTSWKNKTCRINQKWKLTNKLYTKNKKYFKIKFPKLYSRFLDTWDIESKVLGKPKWRI